MGVSDLCDDYGLHPTVYYRWQKEFFEGGAAAFAKESSHQIGQLRQRLAKTEDQLGRENDVLAEIIGVSAMTARPAWTAS